MQKKEKIKQIYSKYNINVKEDYIDGIMKDKQRIKEFMRLYKDEKIDSMNYILGKDKDNKVFTKFELEAISKIDLFDRNMINVCKMIWDNRDNPEQLERFLKITIQK